MIFRKLAGRVTIKERRHYCKVVQYSFIKKRDNYYCNVLSVLYRKREKPLSKSQATFVIKPGNSCNRVGQDLQSKEK